MEREPSRHLAASNVCFYFRGMMNSLELLESRIAPAILTPVVTKGVLFIQHDPNSVTAEDLTVEQTGPDTFEVSDSVAGTDFGAFIGVKGINVQLGTVGADFELRTSSDGLAGGLTMTAAGGANDILLNTIAGSGKIGGAVKITGGSGADSVVVTGGIALAAPMTFDGGGDADTFEPSNAFLAKKLTLKAVENITVQGFQPVVIGGLLVVNQDAAAPVTFVLSNVAAITGKLTYCGSATQPDNVTLNGQVTGSTLLMLFGGPNTVSSAGQFGAAVKINGGSGVDSVTFKTTSLAQFIPPGDPDPGPFITANVAGALSMKLGDGTNTVLLDGGSFFAKGITLTGGTGTDTVTFAKFMATKNVSLKLGDGTNTLGAPPVIGDNNFISGSFTYTGGAGTDVLNIEALIAGTMKVTLGDGANAVGGSARLVGKSATFIGGAGLDVIAIALASTAGSLTAKLNAGADVFTFNGGALLKATLDGGADGDTLAGLALLPAVQKVKNFETVA